METDDLVRGGSEVFQRRSKELIRRKWQANLAAHMSIRDLNSFFNV